MIETSGRIGGRQDGDMRSRHQHDRDLQKRRAAEVVETVDRRRVFGHRMVVLLHGCRLLMVGISCQDDHWWSLPTVRFS